MDLTVRRRVALVLCALAMAWAACDASPSFLGSAARFVGGLPGRALTGAVESAESASNVGSSAIEAVSNVGSAIGRGESPGSVAREVVYQAASVAGAVSGEVVGGLFEVLGLNDTCVGESADRCKVAVAELVQEYTDVGDVPGNPADLWQAIKKRILVHPGTKWCGAGNVSGGHYDTGVLAATDSCCRRHDECPDNIQAGGERHGLQNNGSFTRSNCECDREFYQCLKAADTLVSSKIGIIYFDILRPNCFEETYPTQGCKQKARSLIPHCNEYELDRSGAPTWQWFDNPLY